MEIRTVSKADRPSVRALVAQFFGGEEGGSARVVSRGVLHDADALPGLLALEGDELVGVLLFHVREVAGGSESEVVVIATSPPRRSVGRALLDDAVARARAAGRQRIWLVTTNDNASAFYDALGWRRCAVHVGAVAESRRLKPEIPERGFGGEAIRDEIEYEISLTVPARSSQ